MRAAMPRLENSAKYLWENTAQMLAPGSMHARSEKIVRTLLDEVGVGVDGERPFDFHVHDPAFYTRVLRDGKLGLGEGYMDGQWDCEHLDQLAYRLGQSRNLDIRVTSNWRILAGVLMARAANMQGIRRAFQVGEEHYDLGNDLYEAMLDERMVYTCGYWKDAKTLDEAQQAKLDLVCRKLGLQAGQRVLELGCGWGSFAQYAAENYGVEVTGYTVSKEQVELGMRRCEGLPVQLHFADYRSATGSYDAVVSIGIMEHIGPRNHKSYMEVVDRCLKPGGISLIHTIGGNLTSDILDPFFDKYIFKNATLPSLAQLSKASEGKFVIEDVHNIGPDYDLTLMAWDANFVAAWPELEKNYGDRFYRMWRYYLGFAAGGFRARYMQLYQLLLTRWGDPQPKTRRLE
jgi:cyclopropane-fatty-acyl-phospholipid synthase